MFFLQQMIILKIYMLRENKVKAKALISRKSYAPAYKNDHHALTHEIKIK